MNEKPEHDGSGPFDLAAFNRDTIFNAVNDAIFIHEIGTGRVLDVNERMLDMYRCTREQALSLPVTSFSGGTPPYTGREAAKLIQEASRGDALVFEWRARDLTGRVFRVEVNLKRALLAGREYLIAVVRDIDGRKTMEDRLRESEETLKAILDASPAGIGLVSDRKLVWSNDALHDILGYGKDALLEKDTRFLYPDHEEYLRVGQELDRISREGGTFEIEVRLLAATGDIRHCFVKARPLDPAGHDRGVLFVMVDVTARKAADEEKRRIKGQLLQAQKMEAVGILAGGVAHDFNNILTAIHGHAELARMIVPGEGELREYLDVILQSTDRAVSLTRQLLQFSRRHAGRLNVIDVNGAVTGIGGLLGRLIGEDIAIVLDLERGLWSIRADESNLEQVVMNLALNARDAMSGGGNIRISTKNVELAGDTPLIMSIPAPGRYVRITVSDSGCGIEPGNLDKIFMPFFSTKETGKGTGLGLAVVYGIVQAHGGALDVRSAPGKGSDFMIYMPAVDGEAAPRPEERGAAAPASGSEHILIVEDDENVLGLAASILGGAGYPVDRARNAREAREFVAAHRGRIGLVFCDLVLPDGRGDDLVAEIAALEPSARFLLTSGYLDEKAQLGLLADRGFAVIRKPYRVAELLQAVRSVLDDGTKS